MKLDVYWTEDSISDFISETSPEAASRIITKTLSRTRQLESFSKSGAKYKSKSGKEYKYLIEGNYKIIYRRKNNHVYVEAVVDTRRNPENLSL